jgi:hypothetical protein
MLSPDSPVPAINTILRFANKWMKSTGFKSGVVQSGGRAAMVVKFSVDNPRNVHDSCEIDICKGWCQSDSLVDISRQLIIILFP